MTEIDPQVLVLVRTHCLGL